MASPYSPPPPLSITANNAARRTRLSTFSSCPFLIRNHKSKAPKVAKPSQYYISRVSSKATNGGDPEKHSSGNKEPINNLGMFERRNILIGLGGLYGAATTLSNDPLSLADPILPPDLTKCVPAQVGSKEVECCPPVLSPPIDFKFPVNPQIKKRPAAQFVDATYIRNYKEAVRRMKALPDDDPRNFYQQAKVHCAYCDGAYPQVGFPDVKLQVHDSWLFFPFHRWYLYFHERILGSLIKDLDPNFALPFWNWDSPDGMKMPAYYTDDPKSPLYDTLRNPTHLPPKLVDFNYHNSKEQEPSPTITPDDEEQIKTNLKIMRVQVVSGANTPSLFFGGEYHAGDTKPGGRGTVENVPHGPVHSWTGTTTGLHEDMGNLYSAARDPIFYSHHANVDRMWPIWKALGGKRKDFTNPDWLEAGFVFYDENKNLVRVKVKDCLDTKKLGYEYQQVHIPWLETPTKPTPVKGRFLRALKKKFGAGAPLPAEISQESKFPFVLDSSVSTVVKRPKKNRSKAEKEEEEEVLVIEGIEFEGDLPLKFDVYINDEDDVPGGPIKTEFAGSFVHVPHRHKHEMKTRLRLGITELLEDLGADDDEYVVVTLVPKFGKGSVTIGGINIEFDK